MLLEIIAPGGVTLPRPVEVLAARVIRIKDEPDGFEFVKDRTPDAEPTVTLQLHRRLTLDEWRALSAVLTASVASAESAIAALPPPP